MVLSKERLRILFILPSLVRAGAETQLVSLINGLDSDRFSKHLVVFGKQLDLLDRVDRKRIKFHYFPRQFKFDLRPAQEIARLIDRHEIDIIHCTLRIALFYGWLGTLFSKKQPKLILALHSTTPSDYKTIFFDRILYRWIIRVCHSVTFVCEAQKKYWLTKLPFLRSKGVVIYNGIDTKYFSRDAFKNLKKEVRQEKNIQSDAFVFCCIAGFRPAKRHDILLNAFEKVVRSFPNAFLLLVGDGPLRAKFERIVNARRLTQHVCFLGSVADVRPILMASDSSILSSSSSEAFSMAMLESLAMEVPMIITDVGGAREAVRDCETGYVVPPEDVNALAGAMENMLNNPTTVKMMGLRGREFVQKQFVAKNMVCQVEALLLRVGRTLSRRTS